MPARLKRSFEITHNKSQDGMRARIHELTTAGHLRGFIHAYLGMQDSRLPTPIPDLIQRNKAVTYPTNFAAMPPGSLDAIATRSEQLTRALIEHYCPNLGR
jgi:NTE family protein